MCPHRCTSSLCLVVSYSMISVYRLTEHNKHISRFLCGTSGFTVCFSFLSSPRVILSCSRPEIQDSCEQLCILGVCGWTFHFLFLPNTILWSSGCFSGCTDKMCGCEGLDVTVRGVVISYEPPPSPRWLFLWTRLLFFFFSAKKFAAHRLINRRDGCRLSALMLLLQLKHEAQTDYYSLSSS